METKATSIPAFLNGGGQMGSLIRSFNWSKTALGSPETWPQPLRIAVRIMLDCPFGMYIAWATTTFNSTTMATAQSLEPQNIRRP